MEVGRPAVVGITRFELNRVGGREDGRSWTYGQSVLSVARDGGSFVRLAAPGTREALPGEVLDTLEDGPDHILMSYRDLNGGLNVAPVNVLTGEAEKTIEAASPLRRAVDWKPPVLLIHGDDDEVVPISQSRDMERALRRAGKDVRLVVTKDADHNDWSTEQHTLVIRAQADAEAAPATEAGATP